jgi:hypothetical protein
VSESSSRFIYNLNPYTSFPAFAFEIFQYFKSSAKIADMFFLKKNTTYMNISLSQINKEVMNLKKKRQNETFGSFNSFN